MSNLRIGVPSKGRLSDLAGELLKQAGLPFRRQERSLFARVGDMPIDITFLRTDDIPVRRRHTQALHQESHHVRHRGREGFSP